MSQPPPSPSPTHPPDAATLRNPLYPQLRFSALAALPLAIITAISAFIAYRNNDPANLAIFPKIFLLIAVFTGVLALSFLISIPLIWSEAKKADRALEDIRTGHFYVRWEYHPEFWITWTRQQSGKTIRWLLALFLILLGCVPILVLVMNFYADANHLNAAARNAQSIILIPILFFAAVIGACLTLAILKSRKLITDPPFITYISKKAVYQHGSIFLLTSGLAQWISVQLLPGSPSTLVFRFRQPSRAGYNYFNRIVPIPFNGEPIAQQVITAMHHAHPELVTPEQPPPQTSPTRN